MCALTVWCQYSYDKLGTRCAGCDWEVVDWNEAWEQYIVRCIRQRSDIQ